VSAEGVVIGFDESEAFSAGIGSVAEATAPETPGLENTDERCGRGIVVGIGSRGHAVTRPSLVRCCREGDIGKPMRWGVSVLPSPVPGPSVLGGMAGVLKFSGCDDMFVFVEGAHNDNHGGAIFPDSMRW
jgi:hypothetical protein